MYIDAKTPNIAGAIKTNANKTLSRYNVLEYYTDKRRTGEGRH